ncbi:hypothetical protein DFH94DRAFT_844040 [Russula ochroleuca]|uniref:Uncharacterized protein n=1 Tax=Russula ochroleuca TaxID=152965 RepID=A0A9P5MY08_9AGAM|nr:hypothetical protein DFH94DRAFT_844040 [Russula ochroleuca]
MERAFVRYCICDGAATVVCNLIGMYGRAAPLVAGDARGGYRYRRAPRTTSKSVQEVGTHHPTVPIQQRHSKSYPTRGGGGPGGGGVADGGMEWTEGSERCKRPQTSRLSLPACPPRRAPHTLFKNQDTSARENLITEFRASGKPVVNEARLLIDALGEEGGRGTIRYYMCKRGLRTTGEVIDVSYGYSNGDCFMIWRAQCARSEKSEKSSKHIILASQGILEQVRKEGEYSFIATNQKPSRENKKRRGHLGAFSTVQSDNRDETKQSALALLINDWWSGAGTVANINPSLIRAAACCGEITQISAHGAEASFSITNFPCGYLLQYSMIEGSPRPSHNDTKVVLLGTGRDEKDRVQY